MHLMLLTHFQRHNLWTRHLRPKGERTIVLVPITPGDVSRFSALDASRLALTLAQKFDGHPKLLSVPICSITLKIVHAGGHRRHQG